MTNEIKPVAAKAVKPKAVKKETTEIKKFSGKYQSVMGKRKAAAAQLRIFEAGTGIIVVNGKAAADYFSAAELNALMMPIKLTGLKLDISVIVNGGGKKGQAEAIRHAIAKAMIETDPALRPVLKARGWLTRDSRIKERKKPGLRRARRAPQWSKR